MKKCNYIKGRYFDSDDAHEEKPYILKGNDLKEEVEPQCEV